MCKSYRCPDHSEQFKSTGMGYGKLPPQNANVAPWNEVYVDLIGPWKIRTGNNECIFNVLTCIDPVTNLVELIRINDKSSPHISNQFENCWLSRYPQCNRCIHNNGGKFIGWPFQGLLQQAGIKNITTTVNNPQSNAICERMHQTVGNTLRTVMYMNPPTNQMEANQVLDNALTTAMHATRCVVNATLQNSPGAIVYNCDMLIDVPLIADLAVIRDQRQALVDENLRRQNAKRLRTRLCNRTECLREDL